MHSFPFVDDDKLIKLEKISLGVLTDSMRCDTVALVNKHHCSVLMVGSLTACGLGESFIEEDLRESDQQAMFVMGKSLDPTLLWQSSVRPTSFQMPLRIQCCSVS